MTRVRDVIVCPTFETNPVSPEELRAHPPVAFNQPHLGGTREAVDTGRGVALARLRDEESELVMNACSPRGHHYIPIRQFGQRYSFIREIDHNDGGYRRPHWDPDGVLWDCLSLSRLVRDNAFSTRYAARIVDHEDEEQQVIYALDASGRDIYRLRTDRDWLDPSEARDLRQLTESYWDVKDRLPNRLRRAMWRAEYSCWLPWADLALPIIVSGLESLLKSERYHATSQFTTRTPELAAELDIGGITSELCDYVYDARSEWIHGAHVSLFSPEVRQDELNEGVASRSPSERNVLATVALFQDVLRAAARRALKDAEFRAIFETDDAIRYRWPL